VGSGSAETREDINMEEMMIVMAAMSGLFLLGAYRRGLNDGMRIVKGKGIEVKRMATEKKKEARTDARTEAVLMNIERYNGTGYGQQTIDRQGV